MELIDPYSKEHPNIPDEQRPLYDAMIANKTIKSVTYYAYPKDRDNRTKDITIKNFVAETYWIAARKYENEVFDAVFTDLNPVVIFYMNQVVAFELY